MVTRRAMLKGTAAGSIAAIASAHGVAASAAPPAGPVPIPYPNGVGAGYGNLEGGAFSGFVKLRDSYSMFLKWHNAGAEVFFKEDPARTAVDVFFKFFNTDGGWGPFYKDPELTLSETTLRGVDAGFYKVNANSAGIFLKFKSDDGAVDYSYYLDVLAEGYAEPGDGPGCAGVPD